jgi:hypothetical protein
MKNSSRRRMNTQAAREYSFMLAVSFFSLLHPGGGSDTPRPSLARWFQQEKLPLPVIFFFFVVVLATERKKKNT